MWLVDMVKYMLDWFNIDINLYDSSLGTALHKLITLLVSRREYSHVFLKILKNVLEQKELDIEKVQLALSHRGQTKKPRTESSPLQ